MKWIGGQTLYNDLRLVSGDLTIYKAVNDGNPTISLGSSATERLEIKAEYESGAKGLDVVRFTSFTAGSSADDARYAFEVDDVFLFGILDAGLRIKASGNLEIGSGNAILSDSSGTTTLSNIDALDATTIATFETAMEANLDTFGSQMTSASSLATVGTITTGVWRASSISTTYTEAKVTSIVAGDGIDVSGATGDVTVTAETATDSNPGVVELATTAEADTGTDTARAVTPAGLKSHVDARYASSYITFLGQATMDSDGNWILPNKTGISNHTWNLDSGVNTETNDSTQATIARQWAQNGIRMPAACVIAGISCMISNASGNRQATVGLFCSRATDSTLPDWGAGGGAEPKLQIHADANNESGNYSGRPAHAEATGTVAMAAGDIFYPGIKLTGVTSGGNTDNVYASFTVHIKTLIS